MKGTSKKKPTFIHELPLKVSLQDVAILNTRLDAARQLYNACLSECLKKIKLIRESKPWQQAYQHYKSKKEKQKMNQLFAQAKKNQAYSEYALHSYAKIIAQSCSIGSHLDSLTIQKVASRAFDASEKYYYNKKGRPRFKAYRGFRSVEGKNNKSGIRFKDGKIFWNIKGGSKLELSPLYDFKDKHGVEAHALDSKVKYLRIIKKQVCGKPCWYVQLVLTGTPKQKIKNKINSGVVGLDIGPSTIAIVSETSAQLSGFCEALEPQQELLKKLNKAMDRSRRSTNPEHYNQNKTVKSGPKRWHYSNRYFKLKQRYARAHQAMASTRDKLHCTMVNELLSQGNEVKTEKLSYKSFQKNFGRSVGFRAPGLFLEKLRRKAESAGGEVIEFSTYHTKLSQSCHCSRAPIKKKLSQRWHTCPCGVNTQRDLYSAFLARHVDENRLDTRQAANAWPVAESLLERAVSSLKQQANRKTCFSSFGVSPRQSLSHVRGKSTQAEAVDVVV